MGNFLSIFQNELLYGEEGSCPLCSKTFGRKSSLLNHIRNHSAEKKYVCSYCQKGEKHFLYYIISHFRGLLLFTVSCKKTCVDCLFLLTRDARMFFLLLFSLYLRIKCRGNLFFASHETSCFVRWSGFKHVSALRLFFLYFVVLN